MVDLWIGVRNKATGEPWQEDTMVLIWIALCVKFTIGLGIGNCLLGLVGVAVLYGVL